MKLVKVDNGMESIGDKKKVYITGSSEDKAYFDYIANKLTNELKCICYYDEFIVNNVQLPLGSLEERYFQLSQMDLIVTIISKKFLEQDCPGFTVDFTYAQAHRLNMVPIGVERNLEVEYDEICGGYNLVNIAHKNFQKKLRETLKEKLEVTIHLLPEIEPFSGKIFLSYRKKDSVHALELMKLIRTFSFGLNIEIWYDDFLNIGEEYDKVIEKKLKESDLVLMVVTEKTLESGNYIERIEYPEAKKYGKTILPVSFQEVDRNLLGLVFPSIREPILFSDIENLELALKKYMKNKIREISSLNSDEKGKLATCYIDGDRVEKNNEMALRLYKEAANGGDSYAQNQLAQIYFEGDLVPQDISKVVFYLEQSLNSITLLFDNACKKDRDKHENYNAVYSYGVSKVKTLHRLYEIYKSGLYEDKYNRRLILLEDINKTTVYLYNIQIFSEQVNPAYVFYEYAEQAEQLNMKKEALNYLEKAEEFWGPFVNREGHIYSKLKYSLVLSLRARVLFDLDEESGKNEHIYEALNNIVTALDVMKNINKNGVENKDSMLQTLFELMRISLRFETHVKDLSSAVKLYNYTCDEAQLLYKDYKQPSLKYLLAWLTLNKACVGQDTPQLELLKESRELILSCLESDENNPEFIGLYNDVTKRIYMWPMNLG